MSEKKEVTQQAIGFSFNVQVEREIRTDTGAKYPDKTTVKAGLSGHAATFEDASQLLENATQAVLDKISKLEKQS